MKAFLLAGGFGTRLRPLTYTRPKHLLPIANRAHVDHVFDLLQRHGVNEAVLLTSYLADAFAATVSDASRRGMRVEVTHEREPLGTAGAFKHAESLVSGDTFLAFNGDVLTDVDLSWVLERHEASGAQVTILLTPVEDPSAYGVVPTAPDGRVLGFIEKPPAEEAPTDLINAGVYVFEPSVLEHIPPGEVWSAERQLFPDLVASGAPVYAFGTDAYWMDIGTPQKYLQANLDALEGRYATDAVAHPSRGLVVGAEAATVADTARVSSACLGAGAIIEAGAEVSSAVLLSGASVGRDAKVTGSILGERASVAAGARVDGEALADGAVVEVSA